ncbi:Maf-like protein [Rhizobium sp. RU36D]|uniref:Maf-like protein n=1 Tax=Rhizobium sp. RU36D TaxID=1907415 RepID=UPI0009D81D3D|nr:Maf-like protein [Rhizobium sp. RU36D]SMC89243.1 septum formation protein [Rhizobium sp. RU36D]
MSRLVLASASQARRMLLANAGLEFDYEPATIDERAIEQGMEVGATPVDVALELARRKALDVAGRNTGALVIGCDQTMSLGAEIFHKAADLDAARRQLLQLSGKTHRLNSAVVLAKDDKVVWEHVSVADMECRVFDAGFIDRYLERAGGSVLASVGGYQLEGLGIQLFSRITGDYFTILGLPLLPLLAELRRMGEIDA